MFRPLQNKLLVKPEQTTASSESGLHLVQKEQEKPSRGIIVAAGKGAYYPDGTIIPMQVKEGDTIMFSRFAGFEIELKDEKYLIMDEEDVEAIVESND